MAEIEPTPPVVHIEPDPPSYTYLVGFNQHNYQSNFVKNDPVDIAMMHANGIDTSSWVEAPPEFIPDQSICINDAGIARLATPAELQYKVGYDNNGVQCTYYLVNVGEPQLTADLYLRTYLDGPAGYGTDSHFFSLINTTTDEKFNLNSDNTNQFFKYIKNQIEIIAVPEALRPVFEQCKKNIIIGDWLPAINEKKDELIQTINASDRTIILGSLKTESKYYTDTWPHFYQRLQNIRFNPTLDFSNDQRSKADFLISQIDVYTEKKRLVLDHMQTLTITQLQSFNPLADEWWAV